MGGERLCSTGSPSTARRRGWTGGATVSRLRLGLFGLGRLGLGLRLGCLGAALGRVLGTLCGRGLASLGQDVHGHGRLDLRTEPYRYLARAQRLDGLRQLYLAPVDL